MADYWVGPSYTAGTTSATTIWYQWVGNITTAASTQMITADQVWGAWNAPHPSIPAQAHSENYRKQVAKQKRQEEKARERARKLLVENLSDPQREEFERDGFFHVETRDGQRRYRLGPRTVPIRVHGEDGHRWSYCIHPLNSFPAEDVALALKLMLETNEEEFLRVANASRVR